MDWSKWHVFWVDERVVPKNHEDSNYKLAFDGFLSKVLFTVSFSFLNGWLYSFRPSLLPDRVMGEFCSNKIPVILE